LPLRHECLRLIGLLAVGVYLSYAMSPPLVASARAEESGKLGISQLESAGFKHADNWNLDNDGGLQIPQQIPYRDGVYAFVENGAALYVGVATINLAKRIRFYARPGKGQRTNIRVNKLIREELSAGRVVEIYTGSPPDFDWNGLPVDGDAGLELGMIEKYSPPWNERGVPRDR
jgi:hypothetical protein